VPHVSRRDAWLGSGIVAVVLLLMILAGWLGVLDARPSYERDWGATRGHVVSVAQDKKSVRVEYQVEGELHQNTERTLALYRVGEDVPVAYRRSDPDRSFIGNFRHDGRADRIGSGVMFGTAGALLLAFIALIWKQRRDSVRRYGDA
jgi:hypothetical protein